jgi:hypothetical protein
MQSSAASQHTKLPQGSPKDAGTVRITSNAQCMRESSEHTTRHKSMQPVSKLAAHQLV